MIEHLRDLKPDPANRRRHNPRNIGTIVDSLHQVGAARSIVIDEDGIILAGNGVVEAAAEAGIERVRVIEADGEEVIAVRRTGLTADQKRRLALYDNRAAELAEWDVDQLLADVTAGLTFDGIFEREELDALLRQVNGGGLLPGTDPDAIPPQVETRCQPGDLWTLGAHRLLCGDSTKAEDVARLMGGERAAMVFTSPPYDHQREYGGGIGDWQELMRGVFSILPVAGEAQVLVNLGLIHRDGEWVAYWDPWIEAMREMGWRRFGWYVWDQGPGLPGDWNGRLAPSHEFVFHFNKQAEGARKTKDCKFAGRAKQGFGLREPSGQKSSASVLTTSDRKVPDSVIRVTRYKAGGLPSQHPAVFPAALVTEIVGAFSDSGDIAFEPFLGSGTTLIAAEQLGRRAFGMEIEPRYCDIALARWEAATGREAVRVT